jgi:hypothetical protein
VQLTENDRVALLVAAEGPSGLWDVVWEFTGRGAERHDALALAQSSVLRLLDMRLVELLRSEHPSQEPTALSGQDAVSMLDDAAVWDPPVGEGPAALIVATDAGEREFEHGD